MKSIVYILLFVVGNILSSTAQVVQIDKSVKMLSKELTSIEVADFTDADKSVWNLSTMNPDDQELYFFKNPSYGSVPALSSNSSLLMDTEQGEYYVDLLGSMIVLKAEVPYDPLDLGWSGVGNVQDRNILFPSSDDMGFSISSSVETYISSEDLPISVKSNVSDDEAAYVFRETQQIDMVSEGTTTLVLDGRRQRLSRFKKIISSRYYLVNESTSQSIDITETVGSTIIESILLMKEGNELPMAELHLSEPQRIVWQSAEEKLKKTTTADPLKIHPNPSFGEATARIYVRRPGKYKVIIKSVIGKLIQEYEADITDHKRIDLHFSNLNKGSYICSLVDDQGRTIQSRKLVLLKP